MSFSLLPQRSLVPTCAIVIRCQSGCQFFLEYAGADANRHVVFFIGAITKSGLQFWGVRFVKLTNIIRKVYLYSMMTLSRLRTIFIALFDPRQISRNSIKRYSTVTLFRLGRQCNFDGPKTMYRCGLFSTTSYRFSKSDKKSDIVILNIDIHGKLYL